MLICLCGPPKTLYGKNSNTHTQTSFITLVPLSLYILVTLTKILTFISQLHVKGS